jgi:hypothetical protein
METIIESNSGAHLLQSSALSKKSIHLVIPSSACIYLLGPPIKNLQLRPEIANMGQGRQQSKQKLSVMKGKWRMLQPVSHRKGEVRYTLKDEGTKAARERHFWKGIHLCKGPEAVENTCNWQRHRQY